MRGPRRFLHSSRGFISLTVPISIPLISFIELIADLGAAQASVANHHHGAFSGLVREYTLSTEFQTLLAISTQKEYRRMLTVAEAEFGGMPLAALDDPRVRKDFLDWRQAIAGTSGAREADNRLSAISAMLTWAVERGQLGANHVRGFRRLYHTDRSEIIWLPEHIETFMKVAPIEMQRALILALHTGQREGDLLRLPWSAYDGDRIKLRQNKSRRRGRIGPLVEIPVTAALKRMLDGMDRISPLILTTKTGQSFKNRYFAQLWARATTKAGLQSVTLPGSEEPVELHFYDLRGTAVTLLSEAGRTPQQIATITGHSLKTVHRILDRYLARTRGLAEQAIFISRTHHEQNLQTNCKPRRPRGERGTAKLFDFNAVDGAPFRIKLRTLM